MNSPAGLSEATGRGEHAVGPVRLASGLALTPQL